MFEQRLELNQHFAMTGGATQSLFPLVERWMAADSDRQKALAHVADRDAMRKYQSTMDFLLCETVHFYRAPCQRYYAGKGPQLKDHVSKKEIRRLQHILLRMISACYLSFKEERKLSWQDCVAIAVAA